MSKSHSNGPPVGEVKPEEYVDRATAASLLRVKVATLATWAHQQRYDLPFYRVGNRRVLYKLSDLFAFIDKGAQQ